MERGMLRYRILIFTGLLFQVFLMLPNVKAVDDDCAGPETTSPPCYDVHGQVPKLCYECTSISEDHFCADPFNDTHPGIQLVRCPYKEYCVKWTRTTLSGKTLVHRTCSDKLEIGLRKATVCIEESRPSEGMLCFCEADKCNSASHIQSSHNPWIRVLLAFIVYISQHVQYITLNTR